MPVSPITDGQAHDESTIAAHLHGRGFGFDVWPAYPWMVETRRAHWRLPDGAVPIPLEYTLEARKSG